MHEPLGVSFASGKMVHCVNLIVYTALPGDTTEQPHSSFRVQTVIIGLSREGDA
jgi:hypothetical protein